MNKKLMRLLGVATMMIFLAATINSCQQGQNTEGVAEDESVPVAQASNDEGAEMVEGESPDQEKVASPRKQAEGTVGGVAIKVDYGSPAVKGREVWGGLEKWGAVWRAGANATTRVDVSKDVMINGKKLPAGSYGFFIIPNEEGNWIAIFNEEYDREKHGAWGAFGYKQEKDVLRVEVKPTWSDEVQERLMYAVEGDKINFAWDKARLSLTVKAG